MTVPPFVDEVSPATRRAGERETTMQQYLLSV